MCQDKLHSTHSQSGPYITNPTLPTINSGGHRHKPKAGWRDHHKPEQCVRLIRDTLFIQVCQHNLDESLHEVPVPKPRDRAHFSLLRPTAQQPQNLLMSHYLCFGSAQSHILHQLQLQLPGRKWEPECAREPFQQYPQNPLPEMIYLLISYEINRL